MHAESVGEVDVAVGDAFEFGWVHAVMSTRSRGLTVRPGLLKDRRECADLGNVLWLIGIASVWSFVSLLVVALCTVAGRADRALLEFAPAEPPVPPPSDVGFVATLAEPAPETAREARPTVRTPVH